METQFRSALKTLTAPCDLYQSLSSFLSHTLKYLPALQHRDGGVRRRMTCQVGQGVAAVDYANAVVNDFAVSDN